MNDKSKARPIFFDPKEANKCLYYVGHWYVDPKLATPSLMVDEDCTDEEYNQKRQTQMKFGLRFGHFDEQLARAISKP
eukprot:CAMPEP_0172501136 /NCGR_PEP_ID=MMETSP1066-20121228/146516_1 /TAXON_ID=671091 /ORGANISM="Coscinodiscus wailesii, Strain CCMP2513" /LENGTH=77 /DNA_ID=CAMNT_0013275757 /DNA_START=197 /DNA_END=430 /DNA_ORIENTATION=-